MSASTRTRHPRRPALRATLRGACAFVATSFGLLLAASLTVSGWSRAPELEAVATVALDDLALPTPERTTFTTSPTVVAGTGADAWLAVPDGGADVAVVLQPGAGTTERDAMRSAAEHLAELGVAALAFDLRDTGLSPFVRDYPGQAEDLAAAVDHVRAATGADRAGIVTVSAGGWVAPAAARQTDVDLLVLAVPPVVTPLEQIAWIADSRLTWAPDWVRRMPATALTGGRGWFDYVETDPVPDLDALDLPVLGLWGADDGVVPVAEALHRARGALGPYLVAVVLPDTGHTLPPEALDLAAAWIRADSPLPSEQVHGGPPADRTGVAGLPGPTWYTHPLLHLAIAVGITALVVRHALSRGRADRPARRTVEPQPLRKA